MSSDDHIEVRRIVLSVLDGCSSCGQQHDIDDLRVVGRSGTLWMLGVTCAHCDTQSFIAAVVGDDADVEFPPEPPITEAEFDESDHGEEPISVDDVLDMHEFLESFNGDFHRLFARRR